MPIINKKNCPKIFTFYFFLNLGQWMSPESILHAKYSIKSDVWSFAVTIVEIWTQNRPYPNMQALQAVRNSFAGKKIQIFPLIFLCRQKISCKKKQSTLVSQGQLRPSIPPQEDEFLSKLLESCSEFDPNNRPDFQQISSVLEGNIEQALSPSLSNPGEKSNDVTNDAALKSQVYQDAFVGCCSECRCKDVFFFFIMIIKRSI